MKNDFKPDVGHRFNLSADWGGVLDCEVQTVEPNKTLTYTWDFTKDRPRQERRDLDAHPDEHGNASAHGTVRLPAGPAALLRGAKAGWPQFFGPGRGAGADGLRSAGAAQVSSVRRRGAVCHSSLFQQRGSHEHSPVGSSNPSRLAHRHRRGLEVFQSRADRAFAERDPARSLAGDQRLRARLRRRPGHPGALQAARHPGPIGGGRHSRG